MLGKARDLLKLKRKADEMKKIMEGIVVEVEHKGIKIVMQGDQKIRKVEIDGEEDHRLKDVFNKAVKESQKKAAKKMQGFAGDLGIPGF
jgi:DNA-binding protein YbaB